LLLPAGQLARQVREPVGEADLRDDLTQPVLLDLAAGEA
jgi:hypothetical protein